MEQSELEKQARLDFGSHVVDMVIELVEVEDADGAWSLFQDMGMFEHAECVEFLYFK
jgi:hypothetical protein